jgi:hypothetical protein
LFFTKTKKLPLYITTKRVTEALYLIGLREAAFALGILVDRRHVVTDGECEDGLCEPLPLGGPAAGRPL